MFVYVGVAMTGVVLAGANVNKLDIRSYKQQRKNDVTDTTRQPGGYE